MVAAYWAPISVFNVWIVVVTMAQHHDEGTRIYETILIAKKRGVQVSIVLLLFIF